MDEKEDKGMSELIIVMAETIPATGDNAPIKACLAIAGIAAVIMIVTTIISKKKK